MAVQANITTKGVSFKGAYVRILEISGSRNGWRANIAVYPSVELARVISVEVRVQAPTAQVVNGKAQLAMAEQIHTEQRQPEPFHTFGFQAPYVAGEDPFKTLYEALPAVLSKEFAGAEISSV